MSSVVDLWFKVQGKTVPTLHGHALYAALCRVQPALHNADWLGIHTFHGVRVEPRVLGLPRGARLGLRLPHVRIPVAMGLVGAELDIKGHHIGVGLPEVHPLVPASSLSARMAIIKGCENAEAFAEAVKRQLTELDIRAQLEVGPRLVQRIGGRTIVGFALRLHHLDEADSIRLQEVGIGGRRRFGCGLLRPSRVAPPEEA